MNHGRMSRFRMVLERDAIRRDIRTKQECMVRQGEIFRFVLGTTSEQTPNQSVTEVVEAVAADPR